MKTFVILVLFVSISFLTLSQSLIGSWQLMKQTSCVDDEISDKNESTQGLVNGMNDKTPQILRFKDSQSGDESTKIVTKGKVSNSKNFLYKFDGTTLYILDKRSHIIIDSFAVESLQSDSLILSNVSRPCETKVFAKVK